MIALSRRERGEAEREPAAIILRRSRRISKNDEKV
jgi:hypothetical protein